jgi:hypothetical protein
VALIGRAALLRRFNYKFCFSMAALAVGKIRAERQFCPTFGFSFVCFAYFAVKIVP